MSSPNYGIFPETVYETSEEVMNKVTKKQKQFCEEYLIDLNATQAAIRAGYSPESAYSSGQENLKKPEIRAHIDKAIAERSKRIGVNADRVVSSLPIICGGLEAGRSGYQL